MYPVMRKKQDITVLSYFSVSLRVLRGGILTAEDTERHGVDCYVLFIS